MDRSRASKLQGSLTRFLTKAGRGLWSGFDRRKEVQAFQDQLSVSMNRQVRQTLSPYTVMRILTEAQKAETLTNRIKRIIADTFRPLTSFMTASEVSKYLKWSAEQGGQQALRQLGVRLEFNLSNGPFLETLDKRGSWLLKNIDDTTLSALQDKVVAAIKDGMTATEIQASITAEFEDDINPYRAEMITRTEFANAATMAQKATYTKSGVTEWTWSQAPGDEDDECTDNDGETVTIGDAFPSGDTQPPVHPNCKCSVTPVPPDDWDMEGAWLGD